MVAALTAQNTQAVTGVHVPPTDFLRLQINTLFADVTIHATKIGMLGSAEVTTTVAERLAHWQAARVVLDPVMVAKSGDSLLARSAISAMRETLFPQAFLITPNLPEAGVLLEQRAPDTVKEMYRAAERLRELLPLSSERWVLLKGGHLPGNELVDLLFDGDRMVELPAQLRHQEHPRHRLPGGFSSAIAALLPQAEGQFRPVEIRGAPRPPVAAGALSRMRASSRSAAATDRCITSTRCGSGELGPRQAGIMGPGFAAAAAPTSDCSTSAVEEAGCATRSTN